MEQMSNVEPEGVAFEIIVVVLEGYAGLRLILCYTCVAVQNTRPLDKLSYVSKQKIYRHNYRS